MNKRLALAVIVVPGRNMWHYVGHYEIGGNDEIHGESGDDTAYGAVGNDVIYGDAQDDDLIGGWGNDWLSGGTGRDGILGDDGRIFTSRNSSFGVNVNGMPVPGNADETSFSEPLFGVADLVAVDPDTRTSQGYVLNEFVYTPGHVQAETFSDAPKLGSSRRSPECQDEGSSDRRMLKAILGSRIANTVDLRMPKSTVTCNLPLCR